MHNSDPKMWAQERTAYYNKRKFWFVKKCHPQTRKYWLQLPSNCNCVTL